MQGEAHRPAPAAVSAVGLYHTYDRESAKDKLPCKAFAVDTASISRGHSKEVT